jgi:hypothetical protein
MLPTLRSLGESLRMAVRADIEAERVAIRRRKRPRLVIALAGTAFLAAGAAGAASLIGVGEPMPEPRQLRPLDTRPTGSPAFAVQASDPTGGLPWAVQIYTNDRGADCAAAGRRRGQEIGFVEGGRFRPLPAASGGACGDLRRTPLLFTVLPSPESRRYTLLFGRVRQGIREVRISGAGKPRTVPVSRGAFLAVYSGAVSFKGLTLTTYPAGA